MTRFDLKSKFYGYEISTVELPEGYSQSELGGYETMIQGYHGDWLDFQERSNTIDQALADHIKALAFCVKQYNMEVKK